MTGKEKPAKSISEDLERSGQDAQATRSSQSKDQTVDDLDAAIQRAVGISHRKADPENEISPEFLKRIGDSKFISGLADELVVKDDDSFFKMIQNRTRTDDAPPPIKNFELLEELGSGGMGRVFKVRQTVLGQIQALKLVHAHRIADSQSIARFKNEMRAIGALKHPNIVAAQYADFSDSGAPYLVMDFIEGQTLSQFIKQAHKSGKPIPIGSACDWIRQTAAGIQYAHDQGIVHRDIKPANIIVDEHQTARILDLGLARIVDENFDTTTELTAEHQVLGTPNFMAPEQLKNSREVDWRADVYGLGATLYNLLTGQVVYPSSEGSSFFQKATQITNDPVPDIRELRPDVPDGLADLISRCLQKSPDDRLATAGELAERLAEWAEAPSVDARSLKSFPTKASSASRIPPNSRTWLWLAMAGFFLVALSVIVIRLQLPGGGELVIECDDPNVEFTIVAKRDSKEKSISISQGKNGMVKLDDGVWDIQIKGLDADRYEVSQKQVVISKGKTERIRVFHTTPDSVAVSSGPSSDSGLNSNNAVVANDAAPGLPGYVPFTKDSLPESGDWQIIPKFVGNLGQPYVSPNGTYVITFADKIYDPYTRILERKTGRVVGIFFNPVRYERFISWSPDETKFVIHWFDWNQKTTSICRIDGLVLNQWTNDAQPWPELPEWSPDGSRILFFSENSIEQRNVEGDKIATFEAPSHGGDVYSPLYHRPNSIWSPDGSKFAFPVNGEVRVYDKDGGKPVAVLKEEGLDIDNCLWHPSGSKLLTNGVVQDQERSAVRLWSLSGDFVRFGFTRLHETVAGFSPDGNSLLTNYGAIRDLDGKVIGRLKYHSAIQSNPDVLNIDTMVIRWIDNERVVVFDKTKSLGASTEFDSQGQQLSYSRRPVPAPGSWTPWKRDADPVVKRPSPMTLQFDDGMKFQFGSDGKVDGIEGEGGPVDAGFDPYLIYIKRQTDGRVLPLTQEEFKDEN